MTLLLTAGEVAARVRLARGPLAPLAQSLSGELRRVIEEPPEIPRDKAMLSRDGGRCARDGNSLDFDPWSPHRHICPRCGAAHGGELHDRWWVMWQQLWLAERTSIAATLHLLNGEERPGAYALAMLAMVAERYLEYPNRDNVLGPSRPFFSTYLESIWLLQLCVALDLLELGGASNPVLGGQLRDRVIEPSTTLIASFDEGDSNRQLWNNVALMAAGALLARDDLLELGLNGRSGMRHHLERCLLADGSWYEGENYHLFAHRALWYGVRMCDTLGLHLPATLLARYREAFAVPLLTALPDMTFPARRDSQYGVTLRQWRFAESLELGVAEREDERLVAGLHRLYSWDGPRADSGRWRSTAEAERNAPPSRLSRDDLGWKSLLRACETLPSTMNAKPESVLLEAQGFVVLRPRDAVFVALDYGESGGGHGHPDRLNLMLVVGDERWLDDPGTGSYVDPTLFWYRSTLAHNAPLVDGRSQWRGRGELRAFAERQRCALASAELAPGVVASGVAFRRTIVTTREYLLDRLIWDGDTSRTIDVPFHVPFDAAQDLSWRHQSIEGDFEPVDGFSFLHDTEVVSAAGAPIALRLRENDDVLRAMLLPRAGEEAIWWRARSPGPPGKAEGAVLALRARSRKGELISVWSWGAPVQGLASDGDAITVRLSGQPPHIHRSTGDSWTLSLDGGREWIELRDTRQRSAAGVDEHASSAPAQEPEPQPILISQGRPFRCELGEWSYRRSEDTWSDAGSPRAVVDMRVDGLALAITITVWKQPLLFHAPPDDPRLDNEPPAIHGDGVQLHILPAGAPEPVSWLLVPEHRSERVRLYRSGHAGVADPDARWEIVDGGYRIHLSLPAVALAGEGDGSFALDVLVNEIGPGRQRRRGQLVLSGGAGESVYLRGDRQPVERFLRFQLASDR